MSVMRGLERILREWLSTSEFRPGTEVAHVRSLSVITKRLVTPANCDCVRTVLMPESLNY
jgi:hypothetical protein